MATAVADPPIGLELLECLVQALLDSPMFETRWRWNLNRSLAVPRFWGGREVPPHIQRMQAEDMLSLTIE